MKTETLVSDEWFPTSGQYILTSSQMREADRYTSECLGIPEAVLMEKAALCLADSAEKCAASAGTDCFIVFSGKGNNGADGLAAGRLLLDRGYRVRFYADHGYRENSQFEKQALILRNMGFEICPFPQSADGIKEAFCPAVVIDALCGTGMKGALRSGLMQAAGMINLLKSYGCTVISADIPSGVSSDDGTVSDGAVRADMTVTFGYAKRGHYLFPGAAYCGKLSVSDIGIYLRNPEGILFWTLDPGKGAESLCLSPRDESGNKKTFGRILVYGGASGMAGAAVFTASAALRCGAGMVRIVAEDKNREIIQTLLPEALYSSYSGEDEQIPDEDALAEWADVFVMGPGAGRSEKAGKRLYRLLQKAFQNKRPVILDADALNLVSADPSLDRLLCEREADVPLILTPHPGELAALCGTAPEIVKKDLLSAACGISDKFRAYVAAKDARTLVVAPCRDNARPPVYLNLSGSSALSTAGSGDVLAGLAAAFSASEKDPYKAAVCAVFVHGLAGRKCAEISGERGVIASDLPQAAALILNR